MEGHVVYISRIKSECCPVKYLEAYLQKAKLNIFNDKERPLICHIFKRTSGHKISKTKEISYSRVKEIFKGYILEITTIPKILVYTVSDQVMHQLQTTAASQIG